MLVTVGEHPRVSTMIVDFLVVDYMFSYNAVIRWPMLKALKAITSIYHLAMKFPIAEGIGNVHGSQYDT